jgi:hypothetical protein
MPWPTAEETGWTRPPARLKSLPGVCYNQLP